MEKIKLNINNKCENKVVKFLGNKIEVKPFISTKDMLGITSTALEQFETSFDKYKEMPLIKTIFDILVVHYCTNVKVDGVSFEEKDKIEKIKLDLNAEKVENFENSGILQFIEPYIYNYNKCFDFLIKTLEMHNQYQSILAFGNVLPDSETLSNALKQSFEAMVEAKKKDPETFDKIVKEVSTQQIRENSLKEVKAKKVNKK